MSAEKIQELENTVVQLKSRLFDAAEAVASHQSSAQQLQGILANVVALAGVPSAEDGSVKIDVLYDTLREAFKPEVDSE